MASCRITASRTSDLCELTRYDLLDEWSIANALIEFRASSTTSALRPCYRPPGSYPKTGVVRMGDKPLVTKKERSVRLADASWTPPGTCKASLLTFPPRPVGEAKLVPRAIGIYEFVLHLKYPGAEAAVCSV